MTRKPDLYETLSKAGGSTRYREVHQAEPETLEQDNEGGAYRQPGRAGTKPITVHFPKIVRDQLKILAVKEDASMLPIHASSAQQSLVDLAALPYARTVASAPTGYS
jgi:hypothetical protein